ncbi:hypothetical protein GLOTRDRAFT_132631 [Gloeophyllum trabeum ATCC 11539]|uniref:Uncharacterized protein n=1 Tax=Gloeophyllum trabeum (strain ATCC 11539 / FP-39264 / Madison 617) TaxID=670483 RepID=S7RC56_GLOTA|nr:uncharacterized protein GLOTRDRAFT_132631 [Gloeophyllum trabeum ATCC 11539]EPQ51820.1 hypothetical protein GLOTRDRAFT_132631 [Gloeophyllum trabeum ATCC 11539]
MYSCFKNLLTSLEAFALSTSPAADAPPNSATSSVATDNDDFDGLMDATYTPKNSIDATDESSSLKERKITDQAEEALAREPVLYQPKPRRARPAWIDAKMFEPTLLPIPRPAIDVVDDAYGVFKIGLGGYEDEEAFEPIESQRMLSQLSWIQHIEGPTVAWPPPIIPFIFDPFEDLVEKPEPASPSASAYSYLNLSPASTTEQLPTIATPPDDDRSATAMPKQHAPHGSGSDSDTPAWPKLDGTRPITPGQLREYADKCAAAARAQLQRSPPKPPTAPQEPRRPRPYLDRYQRMTAAAAVPLAVPLWQSTIW